MFSLYKYIHFINKINPKGGSRVYPIKTEGEILGCLHYDIIFNECAQDDHSSFLNCVQNMMTKANPQPTFKHMFPQPKYTQNLKILKNTSMQVVLIKRFTSHN